MTNYTTELNPFTGKLQLVLDSTIFQLKESIDTYSNLPIVGNSENDVRITQDTDLMYTWSISLSSGLITDWLQIGSASTVDWSAIENKPSSAVADIDDAVSKKHAQNTDTKLDEGGPNEVSAETLKELSFIQTSAIGTVSQIEAKLQSPYTVRHTDTDPDSLNTVIQGLIDGDILEVDSSATYNPISIPADKELIIRPILGKCIKLTGTECIKLMNGARDTIIAGVSIENCASPAGNERGSGISFGEHNTIVSNISFYNISIDTVTNGSAVMLSYHWTVNGDTYFTPNTIEECSTNIRFINCCFFDANKDNIEGGALALRGITGAFIYKCNFRDNTHSMRQISLQNCINAYISKCNIRNTAVAGTNSEGIKLDKLGSCLFRSTAYVIGNVIKNAIEGIDIDDNVTAFVMDNICYECTEEGISVDDSAIAVLARNLCYNCRYDANSSGIRVENGAIVQLHQNNCVNNITNYKIENGYSLPVGNGESVQDIILKDSSRNLVYDGTIPDAYNVYEALEALNTNSHTQNTDKYLSTGITKTLYVDKNRVDSYVEDGSITRPFKTIAGAINISTSGMIIDIQVGTYTEDVVLPTGVSINNSNANKAIMNGNFTVTAGANVSFRGLHFVAGKVLTINASCSFTDCFSGGSTIVNNVVVQAYNFHMVSSISGVTALTVNGASAKFQSILATISSSGDVPTIIQNAGCIILNTVAVYGVRAGTLVSSVGGYFVNIASQVINSLGGIAMDLQNGATSTTPNMISDTYAVGNVVCGTSHTIVEGIQFGVVGSLSGTVIKYRPASKIDNDSSVTGDTVKDALNNLTEKNSISGNFTTVDGKTITVVDGQITAIV